MRAPLVRGEVFEHLIAIDRQGRQVQLEGARVVDEINGMAGPALGGKEEKRTAQPTFVLYHATAHYVYMPIN